MREWSHRRPECLELFAAKTQTFLGAAVPKDYKLVRHLYLYKDAGVQRASDQPLDAGIDIVIQQMKLGGRKTILQALRDGDWKELLCRARGAPGVAVWGLLQCEG